MRSIHENRPGCVLYRPEIIAMLCGAALMASPPRILAQAETPPTPAAGDVRAQTFNLDIPAQALRTALLQLADATGTQIVFETDKVAGLESAAISGRLGREEALRLLLAGSGFTFRFSSPTTATLIPEREAGARLLGPVRVEGATGNSVSSIGTTDATGTENTGSYTSGALSIASKTPQSLRETPQSVSVITSQQLEDQNITNVNDALNQATGITLTTANSLLSRFYSRGFPIVGIRIDGSAPLGDYANVYHSLPDLIQFDHVEVLRGSDGLFSGRGEPGGSVNLVRKRPLDHDQVKFSGSAGSWSHYRAQIDATGPLGFDGLLRGRFAAAYEDRDFFYDTAADARTVLFGTLETDVTSSTLFGVGASFERREMVPWFGGLPRYATGEDLSLPRDTCLCTAWSRWNFDTTEIFARADQGIGDHWNLEMKLTRVLQRNARKFAYVQNPVNVNTLAGPSLDGSYTTDETKQHLADLALSGDFELFGRRHELLAGANLQHYDGNGSVNYFGLFTGDRPSADVFHFDPRGYAEPPTPPPAQIIPHYKTSQLGTYATLRLSLLDNLKLAASVRHSSFQYNYVFINVDRNGAVTGGYGGKSGSDGSMPPNYSLVYDVNKTWSVYASYSNIFQLQKSYTEGPPPGTALLEPIVGSTYEAGLKGELRDGALNVSLVGYRTERNNEAVRDQAYPDPPDSEGGPSCCYLAIAEQLSQGFEAEISGEVLPGWQMSGGYTFNDNKYKSGYFNDGEPLSSFTPHHLFKLWTNAQLRGRLSRLSLGGGVNAQSKSFTVGQVCTATAIDPEQGHEYCATYTPFQFDQGLYAVFSARAEYQANPRWSVALNLENLFDRRYYQTTGSSGGGNWYGEPRSFMLTVAGKF